MWWFQVVAFSSKRLLRIGLAAVTWLLQKLHLMCPARTVLSDSGVGDRTGDFSIEFDPKDIAVTVKRRCFTRRRGCTFVIDQYSENLGHDTTW